MTKAILALVLYGFLVSLLVALLLAFPTMWLWNNTMPQLFQLQVIDFWMALKLCFLTRFLFGTGSSSSNSKS